jgi:hypothetical protein
MAGAGLSPQDLKGVAQKSCGVLRAMGPQIQWIESYVTDDKIYCVYVAPNGRRGRVPGQPHLAGSVDHRFDNRGVSGQPVGIFLKTS